MIESIWNTAGFLSLVLKTSGAATRRPGICEVGAVTIKDGAVEKLGSWSTLINPEEPIARESTHLHGIRSTSVKRSPLFLEVRHALAAHMDNRVLVGHHPRTTLESLRKANIAHSYAFDTFGLAVAVRGSITRTKLHELVTDYNLREAIEDDFDHSIGRRKNYGTAYFDALATAHLFVYLVMQYNPAATLEELRMICGYRSSALV